MEDESRRSCMIAARNNRTVCKGFMPDTTRAPAKVLQFEQSKASIEGELEKWFRGVMQSNHDLMSALERLRDSYRRLLAQRTVTEVDTAVLMAVEVTLRNARNARAL